MHRLDAVAADQGYVTRRVRRRRITPNPRTRQVHAKVLPHIYEEILLESKRRGVQQGVLLEEMWSARIKPHVYWQITQEAESRGVSQGTLIEEAWQAYREAETRSSGARQ